MTDTPPIGLDTGVFVLHAEGDAAAARLWDEAVEGTRRAVVSVVTLAEIHRLGLKGKVAPAYARQALESIPLVCEVVWLDTIALAERSADLSYGLGIPLADAIILASVMSRGCSEIYTVDPDFAAYRKKGIKVIVLERKAGK
jgi:predicted nucleic acid-binding protein